MKLTDGSHCFVIVGDKDYLKIIRSATALTEACDAAARLRIGHPDQRFQIMEPRFCEHGCCIIEEREAYIGCDIDLSCFLKKRGKSLV